VINRRQWLRDLGILFGASAYTAVASATPSPREEPNSAATSQPLPLTDYEPRSMLHAKETHVERAAFPVIDVHTHITVSAKSKNGVELAAARTYLGRPDDLLAVMERKNIRTMVNLTGGYDEGLAEVIARYDKAYPGRFYSLTEPCCEIPGAGLSAHSGRRH